MPASSQVPQPVRCHDWDSDNSAEESDTMIEARRNQRAPSRAPANNERSTTHRRREPTPSDSGYSSYASGTLAGKPPAPQPSVNPAQALVRQTPASQPPSAKSNAKPVVIQRVNSSRAAPTGPPQKKPDAAPTCRDPDCLCSSRRASTSRRYSISQQQQQQQALPPPAPAEYPYPSNQSSVGPQQYHQPLASPQPYPYQYPPPILPMATAAQPIPRPRAGSHTRPRPVSIHGYNMPSMSAPYDAPIRGPPPSLSAYYGNSAAGYPPQPGSFLASTPPNPLPAYSPFPPGPASPTSPIKTGFPAFPNPYSARQGTPNVAGLVDTPKALPQPGLSRTLSARRPDRVLSEPESPESETDSDDSPAYDDDYRARERRRRYRDSAHGDVMVVATRSRRPSMGKSYTTGQIPSSSRASREQRPQEPLRRAGRSDSDIEYLSASDYVDSDRTTRAVVPRRDAYPSSNRSSRRQSLSTNASSGRTKATTASSGSDYSRIVIEDKQGRRTKYLSRDQADQLQRLKQLKLRNDLDDKERAELRLQEASAYQRFIEGDSIDLTAENIRKHQNRRSGSHLSGRTHRSSGSGSGSKASKANDGIKIESGGTVLHVYGDAKIEMRAADDGGPAHFVVNSASGRDSGYNTSSKSSDSRLGRSRTGSDMGKIRYRQTIREETDDEDGYEKAR